MHATVAQYEAALGLCVLAGALPTYKRLGSGNRNKHLCADTEDSRVDRRTADCLLRLAGTEGEYGFPLTIDCVHGGGQVERFLVQTPVFLA